MLGNLRCRNRSISNFPTALLVQRINTPRYERGDMGSSPVEGMGVRRSMGGPPACNRQIGVRLSANPLPRSSPEERSAYTRVAGGSIPSVAIGSLHVGGPRAGLKSRKTRFDSERSHRLLQARSTSGDVASLSRRNSRVRIPHALLCRCRLMGNQRTPNP